MLDSWGKEAVRCIRCGACQNVCPVFQELQAEATVARGRVRLIRGLINHEVSMTDGLVTKLSQCLMCKACVVNCPSGVKVDKLVEAARTEIVGQRGTSRRQRLIFRFALKNRTLFNLGLKAGSFLQPLLFRSGPDGQGMLPRLPLGLDHRRLLAPLAPKPFRSLVPAVLKAAKPNYRVAFFTGCMINYIYTDTGKAVVNILQENQVEVSIPRRQHCCGTPARISGEVDVAREMAKANIDVLLGEQWDYIVTACGTCGLALKEEYAELLADDPVYREKARQLGSKVKDITQLVLELDGSLEHLGSIPFKVTYHDPCHLGRGLKVKNEPRRIMKSIPGIEFQELKKPDTCCGSGGTFSLKHYELATKINDRKIEDILQSQAQVVVTGCSACRMHIADGLNRQGVPVQVMHTAQLLEMAYRVSKERKT